MKRYIIFLFALIFCLSCAVSCGNNTNDADSKPEIKMLPGQDVKVISINLLVGDLSTPTFKLNGRDEIMTPLLLSYDADSIGVQESVGWVIPLDNQLEGYGRAGFTVQGVREPRSSHSGNYIYYKKDKYNLIEDGIIWLSDSPDMVDEGSRTCCWAILENKETGFRYVHMNTHLFPTDSKVNAAEMPVVRDAMARFIELGFPVFTTGDFNTSQGSDNYQIMLENELINDSKVIAKESMNIGTYNGMREQDLEGKNPIDYCFVSHEVMSVQKYEVINTNVNGVFASDHNGVFVHATVGSLPDQFGLEHNISAEGITIEVAKARPSILDVTFTQATDCHLIESYEVSAYDKNGNKAYSTSVPSCSARKVVPDKLECTLIRLSPDTEYTIIVTPISIIDVKGSPTQIDAKTPARN